MNENTFWKLAVWISLFDVFMVSSNLIKLLYADFPFVKMIRLTLQQCYIPVLLQEKAGNKRQLQTQSGSRALWTTAHISNLICDSGRLGGVFNNDQAEFSQWVGLRRVILSVLKVLWARMKQMQLNKNCDSEMSFSYFLLFCWDRLFTKISTAGFTYAGRKHQLVAANL